MANKQFAVIGLGRFGAALCRELSECQMEVLAIDVDPNRVKNVADFVTQALRADTTDDVVVSELGLDSFDIVFVAIGSDIKASILTTLILKEAGIRTVWVKAINPTHARILQKVGADRVITPERTMGQRVARSMVDKRIFDSLDLGSNMLLTEVVITAKHSGLLVGEHPFSQMEGLKLLALKRGPEIYAPLTTTLELLTSDILILLGSKVTINQALQNL